MDILGWNQSFDEIHKVVFEGIGNNMELLVQSGKYVAMNTTDSTTME